VRRWSNFNIHVWKCYNWSYFVLLIYVKMTLKKTHKQSSVLKYKRSTVIHNRYLNFITGPNNFCFCFLVMLCFKLEALHLLGRQSTTWATPPSLFFVFSYFSGRVSLFWWRQASDCSLPTYGLPSSWNHSHAPPYLVYLLKWDLAKFLPGLD
jgi:hypothetical protein